MKDRDASASRRARRGPEQSGCRCRKTLRRRRCSSTPAGCPYYITARRSYPSAPGRAKGNARKRRRSGALASCRALYFLVGGRGGSGPAPGCGRCRRTGRRTTYDG
jgi:hypothetical protein